MRNVFACLVHEQPACVADLVANLAYLDPESRVLLYDGGREPALLADVPGAPLVHPDPKPMTWGTLHAFAIDCMRFALEAGPFDALTIVDSDQLLLRPGYTQALAAFLAKRPRAGMLGNAPGVQPLSTRVPPAVTAQRERALWLPYCRRFAGGERCFPHWTFWPSTVFTAAACRDLVRTFDEDDDLARTLAASKLWATEEIVLPTLVALLGHEVVRSPFSYDLVRYRVGATARQVDDAMRRADVFWVHPVPRRIDDPVRRFVRSRHAGYVQPASPHPRVSPLAIRARMRPAEGWLDDDEADVLVDGLVRALAEHADPPAIVEVGSFCGRSTVVLASVVQALGAPVKVHAIDPHDGRVGAADQGLHECGPTRERFDRTIAAAGVAEAVVPIQSRAPDTVWRQPVGFLHVDGLHDYGSVARDFRHFESHLVAGAYVAFHDYAPYFPGVRRFVDELLATGGYRRVALAGTMILLRRDATPAATTGDPLVSCIMATYDRPHLVPHAVTAFLRQDHPATELIVVDDGPVSLADVLPHDPRVRHIRLERRLSIGAKRNLGCEAAGGDVLANWDDDDWYASWRIGYQVRALLDDGADVCGLDRLLYLDPVGRRAWRYAWPRTARAWVHDAVLMFTRDLWRRNPFPDTSRGIDCRMLWSPARKRVLPLADETFYVGIMHGGNTSPKNPGSALWQPCPVTQVEHLVGADLAFYRQAFAPDGVAV